MDKKADRTKVYDAEVTLEEGGNTITIPMNDGVISIASQDNVQNGIYFEHSDGERLLDVAKDTWRGNCGPIVSDNIIEAIFELVEDENLNQEKAIQVLKDHGFSWERKEVKNE